MESEKLAIVGRSKIRVKLDSPNSCNTITSHAPIDKLESDFKDHKEINAKRPRLDLHERGRKEITEMRKNPQVHGQDDDDNEINYEIDEQLKPKLVPLQSLPVVEAVFSIEKIRHKIFSELNLKDLKNSRLVSRSWQIYATNDTLLNAEKNCITISQREGENAFTVGDNTFTLRKPKGTLEQFTKLLDTTGPNPFPCNSFSIWIIIKPDAQPDLQKFLNNHGYRMKKLRLDLSYEGPNSNDQNAANDILETVIYHFVTRLLLRQAPNLETLKISAYTTDCEDASCREIELYHSPIFENVTKLEKQNMNLRHVTFKNSVPQSIFECICNLAPKLVVLNTNNLRHYYVPQNRFHLCTEIEFSPSYGELFSTFRTPMEIIANIDGRLNLKLLKLHMEKRNRNPDVWPRLIVTCNKLLEKCKHSLETISLDRLSFLREVKFPEMNKVKSLVLEQFLYDHEYKYNYFAKETRVSVCFPNLKSISISSIDKLATNPDYFPLGSGDQVLTSVKVVKVDRRVNFEIDGQNISLLRRWFPNSIVQSSY